MATRNIVPRADGEGSIGTATKKWEYLRAENIAVDNLVVEGGGILLYPTSTKTEDYTLTTTDGVVLCDATSDAFQITLPTAVGISGRRYCIKKVDTTENAITIEGPEAIDNLTNFELRNCWACIIIQSNNVTWDIISVMNI